MTEINQKEYLKKYLSIGTDPGTKKKKKKKKKVLGDRYATLYNGVRCMLNYSLFAFAFRVKIIDDDVDLSNNFDIPEEELFAANEDAPQIVGVIDERPPELRIADYRQSDLWQPVGEVTNENPSTTVAKKVSISLTNKPKKGNSSRKLEEKIRQEKVSPVRKATKPDHDGDLTPPRRNNDASLPRRKRMDSGSDVSPPRRPRRNSDDCSPVRRSGRDLSPPRKSRRDEDLSPPRKSRRDEDLSPPRKTRREGGLSPPRKSRRVEDLSPPRRSRREDLSPPRKSRKADLSPPRKSRNKDDLSPPRKSRKTSLSPQRKREKSMDNTPSRKERKETSNSPSRKERKSRWNKSKSPEPKKMKKTLDGKTAGLQNAKDLVAETEKFKQRENSLFRNLSEEQSGANAAPILRDRKTGRIRNLEEEQEEQRKKQEEENKNKEKYSKWGKGLKQVEAINEKIEQDLHEMNKPLARYADDEDLERFLKEQERDDDPMLAYIRKKKKKDAVATGKPLKPTYEGEYMPNRFGVRPGYRWDGVDRSNGYEKKWFEVQNAKRAQQEDAYKWSTEDM